MGLNAKAAMLICLGFVTVMAWLVRQVARPLVALPTPLIVQAEPPGALARATDAATAVSPAGLAGRFERPSPLQRPAQRPGRSSAALALAAEPEPLAGPGRVFLPPLHRSAAEPAGGDVPARLRPAAADSAQTTQHRPVRRADAGPAAAARPAARRYRVRRGDCLARIARRAWGSRDPRLVQALLKANPQLRERPDRILVGEEITIPDRAWAQQAVAAGRSAPRRRAAAGSGRAARVARRAERRWYTIRKRDCLASIARRLLNDQRRWREIAELNGLRNANRILPGTRIRLPPPAVAGEEKTAT